HLELLEPHPEISRWCGGSSVGEKGTGMLIRYASTVRATALAAATRLSALSRSAARISARSCAGTFGKSAARTSSVAAKTSSTRASDRSGSPALSGVTCSVIVGLVFIGVFFQSRRANRFSSQLDRNAVTDAQSLYLGE